MAFTRLWMEVARTGIGYEEFLKRRQAIIDSDKPWLLSRVTCPVLGVWGEADPLTDAPKAAGAMREALSKVGNRDVIVKIFPHAGHSLMETPSRKGMAAGVFDYLRQWLLARVRLPYADVGG